MIQIGKVLKTEILNMKKIKKIKRFPCIIDKKLEKNSKNIKLLHYNIFSKL